MTPFIYRGLCYREVWRGLATIRLQDNRGFTHVVSFERAMEMYYNL